VSADCIHVPHPAAIGSKHKVKVKLEVKLEVEVEVEVDAAWVLPQRIWFLLQVGNRNEMTRRRRTL